MILLNPTTDTPFSQTAAPGGATTTAGVRQSIQARTAAGAVAVNAPAAPSQGECFAVVDADGNAATNNVTINGNGKTIDGSATLVLATNGETAVLVYDAGGWVRATPRYLADGVRMFVEPRTQSGPSAPGSAGELLASNGAGGFVDSNISGANGELDLAATKWLRFTYLGTSYRVVGLESGTLYFGDPVVGAYMGFAGLTGGADAILSTNGESNCNIGAGQPYRERFGGTEQHRRSAAFVQWFNGGAAVNMQNGVGVTFIGNRTTAPTADPAAGVFVWSEAGVLTVREPTGRIIPVEPVATSENGGRLTLTTGQPVTTADVTSATVYFTPYTSGRVALYTGSVWRMLALAEVSIALAGLTAGKNYDVFAYANGVAVAIELGPAWTNDTTRATNLTTQDGVLVKSGDATRRYVGTIRAVTATTTEDSATKRFVWNYQNRVRRPLAVVDTTGSWAGGAANTWRQARGAAGNQVEYVSGAPTDVQATAQMMGSSTAASAHISTSVGVDSTTVPGAQGHGGFMNAANYVTPTSAVYGATLGTGYHYLALLEYYESGVATWYSGAITGQRSAALVGSVAG